MGPAQAFVLSRTGDTQPMGAQELCLTVWRYARRQYYELPANILEGITLVLLVFVQDVAFKESVIICAGLLFTSLALHGLAYRAGQCKVWPKIIELAAPVPFVAMIPAGYLAPVPTQKTGFIIINMWFALVEVIMLLAGRNFMMDYLQDWNPKEVWGTPLLQRSAAATAGVWIIAQLLMALAQGLAYAFNLSVDNGSDVGAAVFVCYLMQLLPLLFAIVFTFAYPSWLKKRWGYVKGMRSTAYPPPAAGAWLSGNTGSSSAHRVLDMAGGESQVCLLCNSSRNSSSGVDAGAGQLCRSCSGSQQALGINGSGGSEDALVSISPRSGGKPQIKHTISSSSSDGRAGASADSQQQDDEEQQEQQPERQQQHEQ